MSLCVKPSRRYLLSRPCSRVQVGTVLLLSFLLAACSKEKTRTAPTPTYSLSGRVRLVGELTDAAGASVGQRVIDDADGVKVYLNHDGAVTDSTLTVDGGFQFQVVLGNYFAFTRVTASLADSTEPLHVHDVPRVFADTIQFRPSDGLVLWPNPLLASAQLSYQLATSQDVRVEVRAIGGAVIRTLVSGAQAGGSHEVAWDGRTDGGALAPVGTYWIDLEGSTEHRLTLAFRDLIVISGAVRLTGSLFSETSVPMGERVVNDADGVRVRLRKPDGSLDSVLTRSGRYEFGVLEPGTYRASTRVAADYEILTDFQVGTADVAVPDTLKLATLGLIADPPNPFLAAHGTGIEFTLERTRFTDFMILDLEGRVLWSYLDYPAPPGFNHIHWPGTDNLNRPVPNGSYWVLVRAEDRIFYNLVFKE